MRKFASGNFTCQSISFFLFCLVLFTAGCRKTDSRQTSDIDLTEKFFSLPENVSSSLRNVAEDIKEQNARHNFLNSFIKKNGVPVWDKTISNVAILNNSNNRVETGSVTDTSIFFIPLQSANSEINSYITCLQADGRFFYKLYQKSSLATLSNLLDSIQGKQKIVPALSLFAKFENSINGIPETFYNSHNVQKIKEVSIRFNGINAGKTGGTMRVESFDYFSVEVCGSVWMPNGWVIGVEPGGSNNYGGYGQSCTTYSGYAWVTDAAPTTGEGGGDGTIWWEDNSGGGVGGTVLPALLTSIDISAINDPCLQGVIQHIGESGHTSHILKTYFNQEIATATTKKYKVKYVTSNALVGNNGLPVPGQTIVNILADGTNEVEITLNPSFFQTTTKEWVTTIILHELMHGIITVEKPNENTQELQHKYMFNNFVPLTIWESLKELFPGIDDHAAIALGMDGMSEGYLIPGTSIVDPVKDQFALDKYFQNVFQAVSTAGQYMNATPGVGTPFC